LTFSLQVNENRCGDVEHIWKGQSSVRTACKYS